jgi:hypothetical protein
MMVATRSQEDPSTAELLKEAVDEARELVRIEIALAKNDVASEWRRARSAAIALAIAACASGLGLAVAICAVALATRAPAAVAAIAALVLFATSGIAVAVAYGKRPTNVLGRTRERLESDVRELRHVGGRHETG